MRIYFLSQVETRDYLLTDPDGFVQRLTPCDLSARRCSTNDQYMTLAIQSANEFTIEEKNKIILNCEQAHRCLLSTKYSMDVPWVFAKAYYENGYPHTRGQVIFMSKVESPWTLIHERVHVWQKTVNAVPNGYLLMSGTNDLMRSNPDTDNRLWMRNGEVCGKFYTSKNPTSLSDYVELQRHPSEEEAYMIAGAFRRGAFMEMSPFGPR